MLELGGEKKPGVGPRSHEVHSITERNLQCSGIEILEEDGKGLQGKSMNCNMSMVVTCRRPSL